MLTRQVGTASQTPWRPLCAEPTTDHSLSLSLSHSCPPDRLADALFVLFGRIPRRAKVGGGFQGGLRKNATVSPSFSGRWDNGHTGATLALADVFAKTDKDHAADCIAELRAASVHADVARCNSFRELPGRHPDSTREPRTLSKLDAARSSTAKDVEDQGPWPAVGHDDVGRGDSERIQQSPWPLCFVRLESSLPAPLLVTFAATVVTVFQICSSFAVHRGVCSLPRFCLLVHMLPSSHRNAIITAVWIVASAQMTLFFQNLGLEDHDGYGDADIEKFDHQTNLVG